MKTFFAVSIIAILSLLGAVWFSRTLQSNDSNTITTGGLHWHPQLEIYIDEEKQEIPQNIGLVGVHKPVHTHDDLPIIHLEFSGRVTKDDVRLVNFFKIWGKDFMSFGSLVTMTVNGVENIDLENYEMKDDDKIILRYESR